MHFEAFEKFPVHRMWVTAMVYTVCTIRPRSFVGYLESQEAAQAAVAILRQDYPGVDFSTFEGPDFTHSSCARDIRRTLLSQKVQDAIGSRTRTVTPV